MTRQNHIKQLLIATIFALVVQAGFAAFSFTGLSDERSKNNKYSLRNLKYYSNKSLTYSGLKTSLYFKGTQVMAQKSEGIQGATVYNSYLRYDNGNTSFVFPYKFKVNMPLPKFKTPTPQR